VNHIADILSKCLVPVMLHKVPLLTIFVYGDYMGIIHVRRKLTQTLHWTIIDSDGLEDYTTHPLWLPFSTITYIEDPLDQPIQQINETRKIDLC
jgi:hypothetical protein